MKLRQVLLVVFLVAVVSAVMVLPVAADRPETTFTFMMADFDETYEARQAGLITFYYGTGGGTVNGFTASNAGLNLDGAVLTEQLQCPWHPPDGWGPTPGTFRLAVQTAPGTPESGWQGNLNMRPWTDLEKWPIAGYVYYKGTGFGLYEHTVIEFSVFTWMNWADRVFAGSLKGQ